MALFVFVLKKDDQYRFLGAKKHKIVVLEPKNVALRQFHHFLTKSQASHLLA